MNCHYKVKFNGKSLLLLRAQVKKNIPHKTNLLYSDGKFYSKGVNSSEKFNAFISQHVFVFSYKFSHYQHFS